MILYNYLFYKGYQLAVRTKSFDNIPVAGGVIVVTFCLMLNLFTLVAFIEGLKIINITMVSDFLGNKNYKFLVSGVLVFIIGFYYLFQGRYKEITNAYSLNESKKGRGLHPILVIVFYFLLSFVLFLLAAMYKNGDGLFSH